MDKALRDDLRKATQSIRRLLETEFAEQLGGTFDILADGTILPTPGPHLSAAQRLVREKLVAAITHKQSVGLSDPAAVETYLREAAFTALNRFVALKMLEARGLVQECVSRGDESSGFKEFTALAPGLVQLPDKGYRLYIESLFDEIGQEVRVLFNRRDVASLLWPRRAALLGLLELINSSELKAAWAEDETIGWIYQYFNDPEDRKAMRKASQAPRDSRELAVRNQFFTPRYVVEFLIDNTLGRMWYEMTQGQTQLIQRCRYLLHGADDVFSDCHPRDPRTLKLLDPACGSMHFGLYAFDVFLDIYREAWDWERRHGFDALHRLDIEGLKPLGATYPDEAEFLRDVPRLIIEHNLYGVDIDPRAAQIATLALWLRAQRAWHHAGTPARQRPPVGQGHVLAAIAPPAEKDLRERFAAGLTRLDAELFEKTLRLLKGLPELGVLLRIEHELPALVRQVFVGRGDDLFAELERETWDGAEARLRRALTDFAQADDSTYQGGLFALDALQDLRLVDLVGETFDVVVMNPPFGALSHGVKDWLTQAYPRSKNDLLAIFVERGLELLRPGGRLGAITSRTCFFLSSFQRWREDVVLGIARPEVMADLGYGVMDEAMVEAAAYCLSKQ